MSKVFNSLSRNDKFKIENYIEHYASTDGHKSMNASLEHVLRFWDEAKSEYLFDVFGEKLILEKEIEYSKDSEELADEFEEYLEKEGYWSPSGVGTSFVYQVRQLSLEYTRKSHRWCDDYDVFSNFLNRLMSPSRLAKNKWTGEHVSFPGEIMPNGKSFKVQSGAKVTKVLGKIAKIFELTGYEEFRIAHSQILNQKKLTGTLCLSIHPMDYMTMSDNAEGWSSCMSWTEVGCYRQGTVEMLNSKNVIVAYLKSNRKEAYDWNSKKWRTLIIADKTIVASVKEYPYANDVLCKAATKWAMELMNGKIGTYLPDCYTVYDGEVRGTSYKFSFETEYMYNDTECGVKANCYIGLDASKNRTNYVYYSGMSECMLCGDADINSENTLVCEECEPVYYCDCCGERVYSEDDYYEVDDELICSYCYEELTEEDTVTGIRHLHHNLDTVYIATKDPTKDEVTLYYTNKRIRIYNTAKAEKTLGPIHKLPYWDMYYVIYEEATERMKELAGPDFFEDREGTYKIGG